MIGGFFFERDLVPDGVTRTDLFRAAPRATSPRCTTRSCPIPSGEFSDARKKATCRTSRPATLAHEFQHLINAGRRLYVNNADDIRGRVAQRRAEPHRRGAAVLSRRAVWRRGRTSAPASIRPIRRRSNDFNNYQGDNIGRFEIFIGMPSQTSVYAGNDSLETRGATWHMLRYLADHRGTSDGDTWMRLVNSKTSRGITTWRTCSARTT